MLIKYGTVRIIFGYYGKGSKTETGHEVGAVGVLIRGHEGSNNIDYPHTRSSSYWYGCTGGLRSDGDRAFGEFGHLNRCIQTNSISQGMSRIRLAWSQHRLNNFSISNGGGIGDVGVWRSKWPEKSLTGLSCRSGSFMYDVRAVVYDGIKIGGSKFI